MNEVKIAVLGSEGVGKSALTVRFLTRRFIGEYASSSECVYRRCVSVDGRQVNLELYDPCSQACEGKNTLHNLIHWADGLILLYDITDRASFLTVKAISRLIREIRLGSTKRHLDSLIFLVGNKQDLCHMREVQHEEGQNLAADLHCLFYELSVAEHYQEVAHIFSKMVRKAVLTSKANERRRRPSGSKSVAKLINNVFGKRRKSV